MCEPILAYFVLEFDYKTTAQTEGLAMISKTIALFFFIKLDIFSVLVSFALAQLIESCLSFAFAFVMAIM